MGVEGGRCSSKGIQVRLAAPTEAPDARPRHDDDSDNAHRDEKAGRSVSLQRHCDSRHPDERDRCRCQEGAAAVCASHIRR